MDFVVDALPRKGKLRVTVVACYTRECLAIDVGQRKGEDVAETLSRIWRCAVCGGRSTDAARKTHRRS